MRRIGKRKGEITTQQIVLFIVLIVSFGVILFGLFRLNLRETKDKEACHSSVVLVSKGKGLVGGLDCKTGYVCISGGGECESPSTSTIDVNSENKAEIMKAIADEMADCWWMFGEGELDYLRVSASTKSACAVCSRIEFDEVLKESYPEGISYKEFIDGLTQQRSESVTYLSYLFEIADLSSVLEDNKVMKEYYDSKTMSLNNKYVIITGETKKGVLRRLLSKEDWGHIIPFPFAIGDIPEDWVSCDEYITKP